MKYHEVEEDPDTLAILYRGDLEVRFITADSGALGANDYRVLLWGDDNIVVGISEAYSKDIIDEFVVSKVTKDIVSDYDVDEEIKNEMVRELAVKHLADSLDKILEELIMERDIGAIEDVSFEKGIQDILDDY
tara:strand:+ start:423 stop:821 length:399 start_codon:yes stop_codon:yes gene_type:complete